MRPEKAYLVKEASDYLSRSEYVFLADYQGINAEETTELRKKLAERGAEFHVVKNFFHIFSTYNFKKILQKQLRGENL